MDHVEFKIVLNGEDEEVTDIIPDKKERAGCDFVKIKNAYEVFSSQQNVILAVEKTDRSV